MMVVIFEVVPNPGCQERYLEIAADLKSSLSEIAGFISCPESLCVDGEPIW